jgi:hypothetical protein
VALENGQAETFNPKRKRIELIRFPTARKVEETAEWSGAWGCASRRLSDPENKPTEFLRIEAATKMGVSILKKKTSLTTNQFNGFMLKTGRNSPVLSPFVKTGRNINLAMFLDIQRACPPATEKLVPMTQRTWAI